LESSERFGISRGYVLRAENETFTAVATPLSEHQEFVAKFLMEVFGLSNDSPAVIAAKIHDMYKPYTMRVEEVGGTWVIGFRGHPYRLSFIDVERYISEVYSAEELGGDIRRRAAVATAIGRLHHFINIRDVQTFFETLALTKAYLDRRGVRASANELRHEILDGVVVLHVADMVAGLIESVICSHKGHVSVEIIDTDSLTRIEPHIPVSATYNLAGSSLHVWLYIHGLKRFEIKRTQLSTRYTVYSVTISNNKVVSADRIGEFDVNIFVCHKVHVYMGLC